MNFKEYKTWQKAYLEKNPNVFRADCLNPFISMNYLLDKVAFKSKDVTQRELYNKWKEINGIDIPSHNLVLTRGVRHSLSKLFHILKNKIIYMPQDVYPRYAQLAKKKHVKTFVTYPKTDWESLKNVESSVILLTIPFTPIGRELNQEDMNQLEGLLERKNNIIIDSVYDYNLSSNFQKLQPLFKKGSVIWLHSLSKTYLSPEVLGIVYFSSMVIKGFFVKAEESYAFKDKVSYDRAYNILSQIPNLPALQQQEFNRGFDYLSENTALDIYKSEIAYFSIIEEPFKELLKRNILGVPASVFGSDREDLTVVTGLFYLDNLQTLKF